MGNRSSVALCSALLLGALLAACGGDGAEPPSVQRTSPIPLEGGEKAPTDASGNAEADPATAEEKEWEPPQNWCGTPGYEFPSGSSRAPDSGIEVVPISGDLKLVHPDGREKRVSATEYFSDAKLRERLTAEGWRVSFTSR